MLVLLLSTVFLCGFVVSEDNFHSVSRAVSEEELKSLLRDNLEADLLPWRRVRQGQGMLTAVDFLDLLHQIDTEWPEYRRNFIAIVSIYSGRISWWAYPDARVWCKNRVQTIQEELEKYSANNTLPDTIFVMNAYDKPLCVADACPAPIFSFNKPWREKAGNRGVDGFQPDQAAAKRNEEKLPNQLLTNSATRRLLKIPSLTEHQELKERRNMDPVKRGFQSIVHTFLQPSAMYSKRLPQQHVHRVHRRSAQQVADITSEPFKMLASRLAEHQKLVPVKEKVIKALQTSNVKEQQLSQQMDYDDILFPVLNHPFDHLVYYPWELKKKQAMMRAGIYAAMDAHCSRVRLYRLGITQAALGRMDVGIYKNRHWAVKVPLADPIPMEDHARWRYLISADGQGASWRLAKLLAINSVILKAKSDSIEYYYRSLQKDVHYISVDETDILDVLDTLDNSTDSRLKEITDSAQSFAYRHLSQLSRCAYAAIALRRYTLLYQDLPKLLQKLEGKPPSLQVLLSIRSEWRKTQDSPAEIVH